MEIEGARNKGKPVILIFKEDVEETEMSPAILEVFKNYTRAKFVLENGDYKIQPDWVHSYPTDRK